MNKKEQQLIDLFEEILRVDLYSSKEWELYDNALTIWYQIIENDISLEFLIWVKEQISPDFTTNLNDRITHPMKLWMEIVQYSKLETSNFTNLERKLAGGIFLTQIKEKHEKLENHFEKLVPNPDSSTFAQNDEELLKIFYEIIDQDFSMVSPEFIEWFKDIDHDDIIYSVKEHYDLWKNICQYLHSTEDKELKLTQIRKILEKHTKQDKRAYHGRLLPDAVADGVIVRNVYLNGDEKLVALFKELLARPPASLFPKDRIPESIKKYEQEAAESVQEIIKRNDGDVQKVERATIKLQRAVRGKKRQEEVKAVIRYFLWPQYPDSDKETLEKRVDQAIADINRPYTPKCQQEGLADRLLAMAKRIEPFKTIRHLAATRNTPSILDDGIFGRRSLLVNYWRFRPAAMMQSDIENGDANAICCGAFEIDPRCMRDNTTEFILDLEQIRSLPDEKNNPCIFFKQKDLGFDLKKRREVTIGNETIYFTHTDSIRCPLQQHTNIQFFHSLNSPHDPHLHTYAELPNFQMISSNLQDMNQILAMNFFRFLDNTRDTDNQPTSWFRECIYQKLNQLDDEKLKAALLELTKKMCDTMEFNFYGSFLMNPELIKEISIYKDTNIKFYTLNMEKFVTALQEGKPDMLSEAQEKMPQLFQSYRFIDYLLSCTQDQLIREKLLICRQDTPSPPWMETHVSGAASCSARAA